MTGGQPWHDPLSGWACGRRCEPIREYEGTCTEPDCDGTDAQVIYVHELDPEHRCPCGYRLCLEHPPEIALFACQTCGSVQAPEPDQTASGQLLLL